MKQIASINATGSGGVTPDAINTALRQNLRQVERWSSVFVGTCTVAGESFTCSHDLGKVPDRVRVLGWQSGDWWATEADRRLWTDKTVTLRAAVVGRYDVITGTLQ